MNSSKRYDIVVYGATVAGIVYALNKKGEGKNVLLINRYGFPGGSITSALNCLQRLKEPEQEGFYEQFISSLKNYKGGILYSDESRVLLNPEAVKTVLLELLVASGIDMLFHVSPLNSLSRGEDLLELDLIGKDGIIKVIASSIVDFSENFLFSFIYGNFLPRENSTKINLFTTMPLDDGFLKYEGISNYVKLNDGRYWVSLKSLENLSEKEARSFTPVLHSSGARIQLLPSEVYTWFEFDHERQTSHGPVKTIEEMLLKNFLSDEQLLKAFEIEKY
ncbi:MAG: FAD-dependent oxidoreductase [Acidobacteriota bacterium]